MSEVAFQVIEFPRQYRPRQLAPIPLSCYRRVATTHVATNGACDNWDCLSLQCIYCGASVRSTQLRGAPKDYDPRKAIDAIADWKADWE